MVLCIIALPIFAVLSIFSVKYRRLTLDALDCLFRIATLRKCRSGLDDRIKSELTGRVLRFSPKAAGVVYKNYKIISWIVLIIFLWSIYGVSVSTYNYVKYGNCNGPENTGFCVFEPSASDCKISEADVDVQSKILYPSVESDDPIIGDEDAELTIIEFGCYACPYTKKAEPIINEVIDYYKGRVNFQFKTFYLPHFNLSYTASLAAGCAQEQGAYLKYHALLFDEQESLAQGSFSEISEKIGLDMEKFNECLNTQKYKDEVEADTLMGLHAGVRGTPTFFVNEQVILGPKPFKTFKAVIDEELKK